MARRGLPERTPRLAAVQPDENDPAPAESNKQAPQPPSSSRQRHYELIGTNLLVRHQGIILEQCVNTLFTYTSGVSGDGMPAADIGHDLPDPALFPDHAVRDHARQGNRIAVRLPLLEPSGVGAAGIMPDGDGLMLRIWRPVRPLSSANGWMFSSASAEARSDGGYHHRKVRRKRRTFPYPPPHRPKRPFSSSENHQEVVPCLLSRILMH